MFDIAIVGGGPAGLSAAINARQRNSSAAVISGDYRNSGLYKSPSITNYPGFPDISGPELLEKLWFHAESSGAVFLSGKVIAVLPAGDTFNIGYGDDIISAKSVMLATGAVQTSLFPGEEELLGKGVSYCATCDGMLFRKKRVCAVLHSPQAAGEADYLESIGCEVVRLTTKDIIINGDGRVSSVTADGNNIECAGVFILRAAVAPQLLLSGLELKNGSVQISDSGETSIPGVFAAGDCTGAPHQIAKAIGQGQLAAFAASEYVKTSIDNMKARKEK